MPSHEPHPARRYAVVWNLRDGHRMAGSLDVLPDGVRLEGRAGDGRRCTFELAYESLTGVRIGRVESERIDGRPALVLERVDDEPLLVGGAESLGTLQELAEQLSAPAAGAGG